MQTTSRLVALDVTLAAIELLAPIVQRIRRQDKDLADQIRRPASSIALNSSEANGSDPGTARARWHTAPGTPVTLGSGFPEDIADIALDNSGGLWIASATAPQLLYRSMMSEQRA